MRIPLLLLIAACGAPPPARTPAPATASAAAAPPTVCERPRPPPVLEAELEDSVAIAPPPADPPPPSAGPRTVAPGGTRPGDDLVCLDYPALREVGDPAWTPIVADLARHFPPEHAGNYDKLAAYALPHATHEATHVVNTRVQRAFPVAGRRTNGFYLTGDCAVVLVEPAAHVRDVAEFVPEPLRGLRFPLYITGDTGWDDVPTYVFDEWVSYIHGSMAAVELLAAGRFGDTRNDAMAGTLEFTIYALGLGMAVKAKDPGYFAEQAAFRSFLAWNARRAMTVFRAGHGRHEFPSAEEAGLYAELRTGAAGEPLRAFLRDTWGEAFAKEVLDLP